MVLTKSQRVLRYVLISVLVIVLGVFAYQLYKVRQEKRDFAKAEQTIDSLAQQIEQTIGRPDQTKKNKSCGYANRKFEKGPLGCSVGVQLVYGVDNVISANQMRGDIDNTIRANPTLFTVVFESGDTFVPIEAPHIVQRSDYDLGLSGKRPSCSLGIMYTTSTNSSLSLRSSTHPENIFLEITCGGETISKLFPVNDR
jgi:hypothetical protein